MTTSGFPGALDSFSTKVDGVDDVMADHLNYPQSSIVALETTLRDELLVKNTSGATAAVNDLGYIDTAGEYKTTTVSSEVRNFCVVIAGAANNADIVVKQRGRVTIKYTSTAPSVGSWLTSSAVAGSCRTTVTLGLAVFGVAIAAGSGGTVQAYISDSLEIKTEVAALITAVDALEAATATRFEENLLSCSLTHEESWLTGTTFNDLADDNYGPALWTILNDANAPDVAGTAGGSTDPFTRYLAITLDATTRVGAVQFIAAEKARAYRGATVSLSADLWATGITAVRMAVITWNSTADTITSDVVSSWGSNPTLATNWAFIGTPADITITSSRARYSVQSLIIPTDVTNIGVFIWTPSQEASTDVLNIARVKLESGPVATGFIGRDPGEELRRVNYFLHRQTAIATGDAFFQIGQFSTTQGSGLYRHPVPMRTTPTFSISAAGDFDVVDLADVSTSAATAVAFAAANTLATRITVSVASGLTAGAMGNVNSDSAGPWMQFDARL